jgi:hypothetical protein
MAIMDEIEHVNVNTICKEYQEDESGIAKSERTCALAEGVP